MKTANTLFSFIHCTVEYVIQIVCSINGHKSKREQLRSVLFMITNIIISVGTGKNFEENGRLVVFTTITFKPICSYECLYMILPLIYLLARDGYL